MIGGATEALALQVRRPPATFPFGISLLHLSPPPSHTQPLDVTKTRLQLDKTGRYTGMWNCGETIYRREGWKALYKGKLHSLMPPRGRRAAPACAIPSLVYVCVTPQA